MRQKRVITKNDWEIGDKMERECYAMKSCRITWLGCGVAWAKGCGFTSFNSVCVHVCVHLI